MSLNKTRKRQARFQPKTIIFVNQNLDNAGLDPYEFRVLSYISCRGRRGCFARQSLIADTCQMSVRKVQNVLKSLCEKGFVVKDEKDSVMNEAKEAQVVRKNRRTETYRIAPGLLEKLKAEKNVDG